MKCLSFLAFVCLAASCTGEDVDVAQFAIDADHNGVVDCADLEHLHACVQDPHAVGCEDADVNHDGHVDDGDLHDMHAGLDATGHHCPAPEPAPH